MLRVIPAENNTIACRNKAGIALQADWNRGNMTQVDWALIQKSIRCTQVDRKVSKSTYTISTCVNIS